ncbi:MAG: DNA-3-methyladenine glycosylase 2 family protein [Candidatus Thorarchaeota archaeon]|nr:MAG: DNA-3-methyladenine glycosylase 2 family protein [Candidatus Thorarchaeota archaeon]
MDTTLDSPDGYDLMASVHSWIYPEIQPVPEKTWNCCFGRVFSFKSGKAAVIIEQHQSGDRPRIKWDNESVCESEVRDKMIWTLGLQVDTGPAIEAMKSDPVIRDYAQLLNGIRPYSADTPFEALVKAVIQQQVSYKAANRFTERIVLGTAKPIRFDGVELFSFPDSQTLATLSETQLRSFGVGYKAGYISEVSRLVSRGTLDLDSLKGRDAESVKAQLESVRGVGMWTIELLMISGLGDFSQFPFGDLVIRNVLGELYKGGERMTRKEVQAKSKTWGSAGPMVLYLLMSAEVLGYLN